jgi:hypothetical protein
LIIDSSGDWSIRYRLLFRFSWLLVFLLLLNSFVQAHLWKHRPFRAIDTDHSGGDHICDLRRDLNGDGTPDRLGDCVSVTGMVIAEPSTYETGGWIFWIRDRSCGVMVYGEQEVFGLGDSVEVKGWVRLTNGDYFFQETGLATLGDVAVENGGISPRGTNANCEPVVIEPGRYCSNPRAYGGNLITLDGLKVTPDACSCDGNHYFKLFKGGDTLVVYVDCDTGCPTCLEPRSCLSVTGIVTRMSMPSGFAPTPTWCLAPRCPDDIVTVDCVTQASDIPWGRIKADFNDNH